jgi:hypothetical protein
MHSGQLGVVTKRELPWQLKPAQAMHPINDKLARSRVAARSIKAGIVKLPRKGCEQFSTHLLLDFEKPDDTVNA